MLLAPAPDHVAYAQMHADVLLVFSTPLVLYQYSTSDPIVRLGSLTVRLDQSLTFLCSYPHGAEPASGLQFLYLPPFQKAK